VVEDGADPNAVCGALGWACGAGGVSCSPQQSSCGAAVLVANANQAFSAYFSSHGFAAHACDFGGVAREARDLGGGGSDGGGGGGDGQYHTVFRDDFDTLDHSIWG
jgi:hypothetical protein